MKWDGFALPGVAEKMGVCVGAVPPGVGVGGVPVPVVGSERCNDLVHVAHGDTGLLRLRSKCGGYGSL